MLNVALIFSQSMADAEREVEERERGERERGERVRGEVNREEVPWAEPQILTPEELWQVTSSS